MKTLATVVLLALLTMPAVLSLRGALGSANAIITVEVPSTKPAVVERYITVINQNNESVNISIQPAYGLKNITTVQENDFTLLPNESRNVNYTFTISEPGEYVGSLLVKFAPAERVGAGVGLEGRFRVFAIPKNETGMEINSTKDVEIKEDDSVAGNVGVGIAIVVIIVGIGVGAYLLARRKK